MQVKLLGAKVILDVTDPSPIDKLVDFVSMGEASSVLPTTAALVVYETRTKTALYCIIAIGNRYYATGSCK